MMAKSRRSSEQPLSRKETLVKLILPVTVLSVASLILINLIHLNSLVSAQRGSSSLKPQQVQVPQQQQQPPEQVNAQATRDNKLLLIASGSNLESESFERFNRSVRSFQLNLVALESKLSSDNTQVPNEIENEGANLYSVEREKFLEYKKAVSTYRNEKNLIIMLIDGDNSVVNGDEQTILSRFFGFGPDTRLLVAADDTCWPDCSSMMKAAQYPKTVGSPYINSRVLIGYASVIWDILNMSDNSIGDTTKMSDTLQTFLTRIYLNESQRTEFGLTLDNRATIIQTVHLDTVDSQMKLDIEPNKARLRNMIHYTEPVIATSSDNSDVGSWIALNSLGNYLGRAWTLDNGCRDCNATAISLDNTEDSELPMVLTGIFIEEATPFIEDFFEKFIHLNYPKSRVHLFIHNAIRYHDQHVKNFLKQHGSMYASKQLIDTEDDKQTLTDWQARNYGLEKCLKLKCDYYFSLDSVARLEWSNTLRKLIETNRNAVAPLLNRPGKLWSSFWGSITPEGYYARSHDYVDIINGAKVGLWNVPHMMYAYLIKGSLLRQMQSNEVTKKSKLSFALDDTLNIVNTAAPVLEQASPVARPPASLVFSNSLRMAGVFQHLLNTHEMGHLVDPTHYNTSIKHPDFYQLSYNMEDWEDHYLHDKYMDIYDDNLAEFNMQKPCPDVIWFPLVNERFCREIIEIMEHYGQWSGGTNNDPRIEGGYESVPTRDIHMKQVGLHEMWLTFLKEYVMPVQLKEYIGYEHDPPRADLAFVVRYHPAEQPSLRPHHDSSTYTLNIALNTPGIDYEGGGCKFIRYNCSVTESRRGWALMHPGRLTHYHEGLPVTNGTRYIMVTFVDP